MSCWTISASVGVQTPPVLPWHFTQFAWPADNKPPYPPLLHRAVRFVVFYAALLLIVATVLQEFTPFPALTWLTSLVRRFPTAGVNP